MIAASRGVETFIYNVEWLDDEKLTGLMLALEQAGWSNQCEHQWTTCLHEAGQQESIMESRVNSCFDLKTKCTDCGAYMAACVNHPDQTFPVARYEAIVNPTGFLWQIYLVNTFCNECPDLETTPGCPVQWSINASERQSLNAMLAYQIGNSDDDDDDAPLEPLFGDSEAAATTLEESLFGDSDDDDDDDDKVVPPTSDKVVPPTSHDDGQWVVVVKAFDQMSIS